MGDVIMSLSDIELIILKDIYKVDVEGGKIDFNNYPLKEKNGNNNRIKEFANYLIRLKKLGYIILDGVFVVGGKEDEVYHNNVNIIYSEKIRISGKGIKYIREIEEKNSQNGKSNVLFSDLSSEVLIRRPNVPSSNLTKQNRQKISDWINEITPVISVESTKYALSIIKDRLHNKFDVQWRVDNNEKNSVHLYATNVYTTVYAYLKVEDGLLKSQGPRGINYENGTVKVHKCIEETKMFTTLNEKNVLRFTDVLLKALERPNDFYYKSINNKDNSRINEESNINIIEREGIDSISKVTSIASDTSTGPDLLDITEDVVAVSNLITLRKLNTPLSIGLFGNWGSGKSFYMNKMQETIKDIERIVKNLNKKALTTPLNEKESRYKELFCDSIIQIRFNAWHYVDANLWASLVSHIFIEISNKINNKVGPDFIDEIKLPFINELESTKELRREFESKKEIFKKLQNEKECELIKLDNSIRAKEKEKSNINISQIVEKLIKEENVFGRIVEIFPDAKGLPDSLNKLIGDKYDFVDTVKNTRGLIKTLIRTFRLLSIKDSLFICGIFIIFILFNISINYIPVDITSYFGKAIKGGIGVISAALSFLGLVKYKNG